MAAAFTRQLGAESGVQLNPLRDDSEIPAQDISDQAFGIMMRSTRGRIDKPFVVNRGDVIRKLGPGAPIRDSALNEAWVHVVEALNNGAYQAVIQRLTESAAEEAPTLQYIAVQAVENTTAGSPPTTVKTVDFLVLSSLASGNPFLFAIKHLECFNDGIKVSVWFDEKLDGSSAQVASDIVSLRLLDASDNLLFEFTGSLTSSAKDDFGNSFYLPDVVARQTDLVEITIGDQTAVDPPTVSVPSDAYGYLNGAPKWVTSTVKDYFAEGGYLYTSADYSIARVKLQFTPFNYAYISSGGSQSSAMLAQLAQLAFDTNRQLSYDVPGSLDDDAAIAFDEQLNLGNQNNWHLLRSFWMPVKSDDPTGINGNTFIGGATLNIAYACGRNAQTNAKGFAPKNFPIAGRDWVVGRSNMRQSLIISDGDKNKLARARINPIIFETYTGGSRCVFFDSLTKARVESSLKKLISVADMSTSIDDIVTRFGKDILQLPMDLAVKRMKTFLTQLFEDAEASGWLVPSSDPSMNGASFKHDVRPNQVRPYDRMDVSYWLRYDGTVRQIFVTQTLSR